MVLVVGELHIFGTMQWGCKKYEQMGWDYTTFDHRNPKRLWWFSMHTPPKQLQDSNMENMINKKTCVVIFPGWWFQPLWKNISSMGRIIPYIMENKNMFETTNQFLMFCLSAQWEFQDPKLEVLYYIRPYFRGISPHIALKNWPDRKGRYLQSIGSCCTTIEPPPAIGMWKISGDGNDYTLHTT